jgi:acyl-ACP thioesterase
VPLRPCDDERVASEFVDLPARGRVFRGSRRVHLGDVDAQGSLRLEALARFLQDVATDDADDADLSEARGVWVLRSSDLEVATTPVYHEVVELATFCSGTGPRWAERRTRLDGDRGARVESAGLWVFIDREQGRPLPLDDDFHDRYGESAGGRRVKARLRHPDPPAGAPTSAWMFRQTDLDMAAHVNNAVYWTLLEEELAGAEMPAGWRGEIEHRGPAGPGVATVAADGPLRWVLSGGEVVASLHAAIG